METHSALPLRIFCSECGGEGFVEYQVTGKAHYHPQATQPRWDTKPCEACDGTGWEPQEDSE